MRGITEEERDALTLDTTFPDAVIDRLVARELLQSVCFECDECGSRDDSCDCDCTETECFDATAAGHLALRVDAAARALAGVEA